MLHSIAHTLNMEAAVVLLPHCISWEIQGSYRPVSINRLQLGTGPEVNPRHFPTPVLLSLTPAVLCSLFGDSLLATHILCRMKLLVLPVDCFDQLQSAAPVLVWMPTGVPIICVNVGEKKSLEKGKDYNFLV